MALGNPYTEVSIANYNVTPPTDDGAATAGNTVEWAKHKTKLADPIKTLAETTQTNITAALDKRVMNGIVTTAIDLTVLTTQRGKVIQVNSTSDRTITLPAVADAKLGFELIITNINTGTATVTGNGAETISGFANVTMKPNRTIWVMCDGSNWIMTVRDADFALPRNQIDGLILSNNTTDAQHDIDISIGQALDSANEELMELASVLVKRIDASWAAGTNQGGFPTGITLSATTWYHMFLLRDRSAGDIDAGFDSSIVATNLLADATAYTQYRRIGSVLTDGTSNIIAFHQTGDQFLWVDPPLDVNASNPGTTAVSRTLSTPPDVKTEAFMNVVLSSGGAVGNSVYLSSLDVNDEAASPTVAPLGSAVADMVNQLHGGSQARVLTNTSRQIRSRVDASDASTAVYIATLGWKDFRGKE